MNGVTGILSAGKENTINFSPPSVVFFLGEIERILLSVFLISLRNATKNCLGFVLFINFKITTIVVVF